MSSRIRLLVDNLLDAGVLTASSATPALPVANLQDQLRGKVWRTLAVEQEYFDLDLGAQGELCNALALVNHNLTPFGTITILAGDYPGDSSKLAYTSPAWEPAFFYGDFVWSDPNYTWGGYLFDRSQFTDPLAIIYFPQALARYWRVILHDPGNPAGYLQAGRAFLGSYFEPQIDLFWPYRFVAPDLSTSKESLGGQLWTDLKPKRHEITFTFGLVAPEDTWWGFVQAFRRIGTSRDVIVDPFPDPEEGARRFWMRLYGRLKQEPEVSFGRLHRGSFDVTFKESL